MRTALYMRMSTDKQENSIDSQEQVLTRYAQSHKMKIVNKYVDEGISGRRAEKRPDFMRMIEDSGKDMFDAVLVYDSSRFARNLEESIVYKSVLKKNNVELISSTEPSVDEDSSLITDAMLGALNEMYSRKLSKAVKRGMVYRAQKGYFQTPPPYGYTKKDAILIVDTEEAPIVIKIFNLFLEYSSWHSVAYKLNETGVTKRKASAWYARDIKRMLLNQAYIGNLFYDGEIYKGLHDPIIDKELWEKVQAIISNKPKSPYRPPSAYKHWLSGLLICGTCGARMNHSADTKGSTGYRCSRYANAACKTSNYLSISKLEIIIKSALETALNDKNLINYQYFVRRKNNGNELEDANNALKKVLAKLTRHKEAYSNGVDTLEEYRENKEKCLFEEKRLKDVIKQHSRTETTKEQIKHLQSNVKDTITLLNSDSYTLEQKSNSVKNLIEKIVVDKYAGYFTVYYYI